MLHETLTPQSPVEKHITLEVPIFSINDRVGTIKNFVINRPQQYRKLNYVYFEDANKKLTGLISLHTLLALKDDEMVNHHVIRNVKHCFAHTTLEKATAISLHQGITDLPVINKDGTLLGVLTSDTILHFASAFFSSKHFEHGGIVHGKSLYDLVVNGSLGKLFVARLPWLFLGAVGGVFSARVVGFFEGTIEQNITLALFIPAIVYMSDAVGTQTETLFIRTLALKDDLNILNYVLRDFLTALLLGGVIGLVFGVLSYLWKGELISSLIIGMTMLINTAISSPVAIVIPTIFRKLRMDPAIGSGPLATIIQDLLSLVVYFAIALAALKVLNF
ncbi:MAG: magnesium transporter [Patescibacteria group bacterium]